MTSDPSDVASRIAQVTSRRTLDDPEIDQAVLTSLLRIFDAASGRIYTLDLSTGFYKSKARDSQPDDAVAFDARRLRDHDGWGPLEQAVFAKTPQILSSESTWDSPTGRHDYGSRIVLPILRQETVVGVVDLHSPTPDAFRQWTAAKLLEAAPAVMQQLANAYEARSVHRILERTAEFKVDLYEDEATALQNLMEFVGESSGMEYTVLRRLEGDNTLRCVATHGFPTSYDKELSLHGIARDYKPFAEVIATHSHWKAQSLDGEEYRALREHPEISDIKSFVACPVLLGKTIWGVLSFAAAVPYDYSDLEVYSLRALANLAGVALDAAQSAEQAAEVQFDDGQLMQAALSNEVIVATRHEMSDQMEIIGTSRSALFDIVIPLTNPDKGTRLTRRDIDDLVFVANSLDQAHGEINKIVDTIQVSQRELLPEHNKVIVSEIWQRAKESFSFRIRRARVARVHCDVPETLAIEGSADWLRIVFMHLLLNSLDAFDRPHAKGRREIVLRQEEQRAGSVVLRYYDTAGGIVPRSLVRRGATLDTGADIRQAVFERFVSSKAKGTGLGLASCRAALRTMGGSIDLIDWRKGITFDIQLTEWTGG